jgi:hypothetical protein
MFYPYLDGFNNQQEQVRRLPELIDDLPTIFSEILDKKLVNLNNLQNNGNSLLLSNLTQYFDNCRNDIIFSLNERQIRNNEFFNDYFRNPNDAANSHHTITIWKFDAEF